MAMPPRSRHLPPPARAYDRRAPVPSYPKGSSKRDYVRREELQRLRNKRLVFVGDSLNRGQWVSMVCMVDTIIPPNLRSLITNGSLITFKAIEYNATIEFYWAPLLVESNSDHPVNHRVPERIARVQAIEKHARHWTDADILVFNSYLWWRLPYMKVLKSKKKLEELLHHWSQWHAKECSNSEDSNELLESGEETYYPALHVGSSPMSFVLDNQVRKKQRKDTFSMNDESVPLYDREYAMSLNTVDGASKVESSLGKLEASRCFNCGSYNHSLKECSKPRDATAVKNARKQHVAKKGHSAGPRVLTRYYQSSPGGKYDGLKPGVLGAETRQLLGLSELDPPPWMNRMREIGYPPGYLDLSEEDKPSGIKIYGDEDSGEQDEAKLKLDETKSIKKMTVDFPGVNAVIPENADPRKWNSISPLPTFNSCVHQSDYRSHSSSEFSNTTYPLDPIWSGGFPRSNYLGISPPIPSYLANYNSYPNVTNNPLVARLSHYVAMQRKSSYSFLPNLSPYSYQSPHR